MLVRSVKKDGDGCLEWCFGHSFGDYCKGQYQIAQDIYTALNEWKYDCFFAMNNGIDWYLRLGKRGQKQQLDSDIINTVRRRIGVISVVDFTSSLVDRHYSCSFGVFTEFTEEPISINFSI